MGLTFKLENSLRTKGYLCIAGIDEAGRGPLAGPVTAAAVILPENFNTKPLRDSKLLTEKARNELAHEIRTKAIDFAVVHQSSRVIDELGILNAAKLAMAQAVKKLQPQPDFLLLDAVNINMPAIAQLAIIKGDRLIASIAAASILAKVERDRVMLKLAQQHPGYGFEIHKGYGTAEHFDILEKLGPSAIHRKSFAPVANLNLRINS